MASKKRRNTTTTTKTAPVQQQTHLKSASRSPSARSTPNFFQSSLGKQASRQTTSLPNVFSSQSRPTYGPMPATSPQNLSLNLTNTQRNQNTFEPIELFNSNSFDSRSFENIEPVEAVKNREREAYNPIGDYFSNVINDVENSRGGTAYIGDVLSSVKDDVLSNFPNPFETNRNREADTLQRMNSFVEQRPQNIYSSNEEASRLRHDMRMRATAFSSGLTPVLARGAANYLTDEEIDTMVWLDMQGFQNFNLPSVYLNSIATDVQARSDAQLQNEIEQDGNIFGRVGMAMDSIARTPLATVEYLPELAGRTFEASLYGNNMAVDPNSSGSRAMQNAGLSQQLAIHDTGFVGGLIGNAAISSANSLANLALLGPTGGAISMGLQAGAQGAYDAGQSGGDIWQQLAQGALTGASEAAFERISFGVLDKIINNTTINSIQSFLRNVGAQVTKEGITEGLTELSNIASNLAVMGRNSDIATVFNEYLALHPGENNAAFVEAVKYAIQRVAYSSAVGALAGGGMGTVGAGVNVLNNREQATQNATGVNRYAAERQMEQQEAADIENYRQRQAVQESYNRMMQAEIEVQNESKQIAANMQVQNFALQAQQKYAQNIQIVSEQVKSGAISRADGTQTLQVIEEQRNLDMQLAQEYAKISNQNPDLAIQMMQGVSQNEVLSNASQQWNAGESTRGQSGSIYGTSSGLGTWLDARGTEQTGQTQSGLESGFGKSVSYDPTQIEQRDTAVGLQSIVKPEAYSPEQKAIADGYEAQGIAVDFTADPIEISTQNGVKRAEGAYFDGRILVDGTLSEAEQKAVADHEYFHAKTTEANTKNAVAYIKELSGEQYDALVSVYSEAYGGVYDGNVDAILEEMAADLYSGKGAFKGISAPESVFSGLNENAEVNKGTEAQFSLKQDFDGTPYVEVDGDILSGVPKKEWPKVVKQTLLSKFGGGIDMGSFSVAVTGKTAKEWAYSKEAQNMRKDNPQMYQDKMRMANNADEIVQNAANVRNEDPKHQRKDSFTSFNRGDIRVKVGENAYTVAVVTGIKSNGIETLYDVVSVVPFTQKNNSSPRYSLSGEPSVAEQLRESTVDTTSVADSENNVKDGTKFSLSMDSEGNTLSKQQLNAASQVKNTDNKTPTDSPDIRYSFSYDGKKYTAINTVANENSLVSQEEIDAYVAAVDPELLQFVQGVEDGNITKGKPFELGKVPPKLASEIQKITGVDVSGYTHAVLIDGVQHIFKRHGKKGKADQSMRYNEDIARLPYVLKNYDTVYRSFDNKGNPVFATKIVDGNGNPAQVITIEKAVDGTYFVSEAVLDNKNKRLRINSAYMNNNNVQSLDASTDTPRTTSENGSASTQNLPQNAQEVNRQNQNTKEDAPQVAEKKSSKFAETAANSDMPSEITDTIKDEIEKGTFEYEVSGDKNAVDYARRRIEQKGFDEALIEFRGITESDGLANKLDIALGELLLKQAAEKRDVKTAMKLVADLAAEGTRSGQAIQALSLINKMTPDGQLYYLNKNASRISKDLMKKYNGKYKVEIKEDLAKNLLDAKTPEEIEVAANAIKQDIARQIPSTASDKWNAWRYLAMLGNPRTHIRNLVGNAIFTPAIKIKNLLAQVMEKTISTEKRTKSVRKDKKAKAFAKEDFKKVQGIITSGGKYNPTNEINEMRRIFNNGVLEWLRKTNSNLMEKEDALFLQNHYVNALAGFMTARKWTPETIKPKQLQEAQAYAIKEAQKATYRDFSAMASALNNFGKKNKAAGVLVGGIMPFTKTPINILKRSVEYSPIGLINGTKKALSDVRKGKVTASEAIDDLAKGMTGTGLLTLGYFLASLGLVAGAGDEDDEQREFDKLEGEQSYSLKIGDTYYSIDWMAPMSLPFFVGAEISKLMEEDDISIATVLDAFVRIAEPITEMSLLKGVQDTIEAAKYSQGNVLTDMAVQVATGYWTQGVPTFLGQIARTIDPTRRTTYVDKDNLIPDFIERQYQRLMAKIPGLSFTQTPYIDAWGRKDVSENLGLRAFENFLSPGYVSQLDSGAVEAELQRLYDETGATTIFPEVADSEITVSGKKVKFDAAEWEQVAMHEGNLSYTALSVIFNLPQYQELDDGTKQKVIEDIYDYSKWSAANTVGEYPPPYRWLEEALAGDPIDVIMSRHTEMPLNYDSNLDEMVLSNDAIVTEQEEYSGFLSTEEEASSLPPANTIIPEAMTVEIPEYRQETLDNIEAMGVSVNDWAYVDERLPGYTEKVQQLQDWGFEDDQLRAMVEGHVLSDTAQGKLIRAIEEGIGRETYLDGYIFGYTTTGSKAERNEQIQSYVNDLLGLSESQKDLLYELIMVYSGSGDDSEDSSGSSSGSGGSSGSGSSRSRTNKSSTTKTPKLTSEDLKRLEVDLGNIPALEDIPDLPAFQGLRAAAKEKQTLQQLQLGEELAPKTRSGNIQSGSQNSSQNNLIYNLMLEQARKMYR